MTMDACALSALQDGRTRFLLVDTDNLFLDGVGRALRTDEKIEVVAVARSIEDAYDCTAKHQPDVIVVSWGKASRAFVHAVLANPCSAHSKPLIVIVLPRGMTSIPGLTSLSLLPNVALLVHEQVEKLLFRHSLPKTFGLLTDTYSGKGSPA